jgi:hypothetical protein
MRVVLPVAFREGALMLDLHEGILELFVEAQSASRKWIGSAGEAYTLVRERALSWAWRPPRKLRVRQFESVRRKRRQQWKAKSLKRTDEAIRTLRVRRSGFWAAIEAQSRRL